MQRLPAALVAELDLETAVVAEAGTWRNLIPTEPWTRAVASNAAEVAGWVATRLEAGARNSEAAVVSARKGLQGIRPVPIVGVAERVAYRALAAHVLETAEPPKRAASDYRDFIGGPIAYAYEGLGPFKRLGDARLTHVVEADIASFYQYVDHEVLQREVEMLSRHVQATGHLVELLGEVQGSSYGLPQLLDPSDDLSEVYIRLLERDVVRRGLVVWRYNDDFRIGVTSYSAAQDAVEQLADAARRIGLVLNDHKTRAPRFTTYALRHLNAQVDDAAAEVDPTDVESAVAPYIAADDDEAAAEAVATLNRLDLPSDDPHRIDLKRLTFEDLREIRRAIGGLGRRLDATALPRVSHLMLFAPSLTPRLCDYMIKIGAADPSAVSAVWDTLTGEHDASISEWQAAWLTFIARSLDLTANVERKQWVAAQRARRPSGLLRAEAALALAPVGGVSFDDLDQALRLEPEPFAPWYVLAMKALPDQPTTARLDAVAASSPLYRLLLTE